MDNYLKTFVLGARIEGKVRAYNTKPNEINKIIKKVKHLKLFIPIYDKHPWLILIT